MTVGAEITFTVDPAVAAITGGAPAAGLNVSRSQWMLRASRLLACLRHLTDGSYGSVTFTTGPDYDGSTFTISVYLRLLCLQRVG